MAREVMLCANVFASSEDTVDVPYDDQESIQSGDGYLKLTRMCFFVVERGNRRRYAEDLLSLKHRLCRHGSCLIADRDTGCHVSLNGVQIENVLRTIAVRVERMMMQNSHRQKISFVATCDVIVAKHGQPLQTEVTTGSAVSSGSGVVVPMTEAAVGVIEKRKRDEGFVDDDDEDDDDLESEMELDQFGIGC